MTFAWMIGKPIDDDIRCVSFSEAGGRYILCWDLSPNVFLDYERATYFLDIANKASEDDIYGLKGINSDFKLYIVDITAYDGIDDMPKKMRDKYTFMMLKR